MIARISLPLPRKHRLILAEFSGATGSEILNVAVVWFLVEHVGYESGYLIALTLLSAIVFGTLGTNLLSKLEPLRRAMTLNIVRAIVAVCMFYLIVKSSNPLLVVVFAMIASAVRPHIDSAVIGAAYEMQMAPSQRTTLNALIDGTYRFARVVGPAMTSLFVWNSTYLLLLSIWLFSQAAAIFRLVEPGGSKRKNCEAEPIVSPGHQEANQANSVTNLFFVSQAINAGAWYSGIVFGLALMIGSTANDGGIAAYSFALLAYGLGNILGTAIGRLTLPFASDLVALGLGRSIASLGYFGIFFSPSFELLWLFTFITAIATPPCDLAFLRHIQNRTSSSYVTDSYRKKMIYEYGGMLLSLVVAPSIASHFSEKYIILACGVSLLTTALLVFLFKERQKLNHS
jgi:hypothetical protein